MNRLEVRATEEETRDVGVEVVMKETMLAQDPALLTPSIKTMIKVGLWRAIEVVTKTAEEEAIMKG